MTDHEAPARVRFCWLQPGWFIATVDGTELSATPVRNDEVETAARELAAILGEPVGIEILDDVGCVRDSFVSDDAATIHLRPAGPRQTCPPQSGTSFRQRVRVIVLVSALAVALVSVFLLCVVLP